MGDIAKSRGIVKLAWLVVATVALAACFALGLGREHPHMLKLADLHGAHEGMMSCAGGSDMPSAEPLWCSDPNSPQCVPAMPSAPKPELWHGQPALGVSLDASISEAYSVLVPWQRPLSVRAPQTREVAPLERPPRA